MHYREFAFEYKMHKVGSPLSLYLENTRKEQEINKIYTQVVGKTTGVDTNLGKRKRQINKSQYKDDQLNSTTHK